MTQDEQLIRNIVATGWAASQAGDLETVLSLMTDDVAFLLPGRAAMDKPAFAALSKAPAGARPMLESHAEILEICVSGDLAYLWSNLRITVTPPAAAARTRAGPTLSVFKRVAQLLILVT